MTSAAAESDSKTRRRLRPLPGWALVALYFFAVVTPLRLADMTGVPPDSPWSEAATGAGCVAVAAMVVQFLTSGRFEIFAGRLGIDVTMAFHKWAARWIVTAVVLHPLLYVVPTFLADTQHGFDRLAGMIAAPRYSTGVVAWLAVVLLVFLAMLRNRLPLPYELWRGVHFVLAVGAVAFALDHVLHAGTYSAAAPLRLFWFVCALVVGVAAVILHPWRWWRQGRRPWRLVEVRRLGTALWEMVLERMPGTPPLDYRAGQFVWMSAEPQRLPLFDHPFSIASSPRQKELRLIVKEVGDFTRTVGQMPVGTLMAIDGPHGHFTLEDRSYGAVLLVAGGVGIAPMIGFLRDLVARRDTRPVRLVYGAGSPDKIVCRDEIEAAGGLIDFSAMLVSETPAPDWQGEVGIFDRPRLERALAGLDRRRTLAMICGPGPMLTAVAGHLEALGLTPGNIVFERFDYDVASATRREKRRVDLFALLGAFLALAVAGFALR